MLVSKWKDYTAESVAGWKWQADRSYLYNLFLAGTEMLGALTTYGYMGILVIRKVLSIRARTRRYWMV